MASPTVSVVLPTFNRASLLRRSVSSVLRQSFEDFELLIVDDGSTDNTRDVVEGFGDSRIRYVPRERNGGVAAARNTGVRAATGQYLSFQDSDDEWLLEKLEQQLALLGSGGKPGMCVCGLMRILGSRSHRQRIHNYPRQLSDWANGLDYRGVLGSAVAYTQTWLVPREAVLGVGGFNESLRIWDDWELLIRLSGQLKIHVLKKPLVISERRGDSLSGDTERFLHDMAIILDQYHDELDRHAREHARLLYLHGLRLWRAGRSAAARDVLINALRRQPRSAATWRLLLRTAMG